MTLLDLYQRCRAADWSFQYTDGETYRSGRSAMDDLRSFASASPAHQHIFDEMKHFGDAGKEFPEFGDVVSITDASSLTQAISYHDGLAQRAWDAAQRAEESRMRTDPVVIARYHFHNAIAARLIDHRHHLPSSGCDEIILKDPII